MSWARGSGCFFLMYLEVASAWVAARLVSGGRTGLGGGTVGVWSCFVQYSLEANPACPHLSPGLGVPGHQTAQKPWAFEEEAQVEMN